MKYFSKVLEYQPFFDGFFLLIVFVGEPLFSTNTNESIICIQDVPVRPWPECGLTLDFLSDKKYPVPLAKCIVG